MTLPQLIAKVQGAYTCRQGIYSARCNTGEPYVFVGEGGSAPGVVWSDEGRTHYATDEEACDGFWRALTAYAEGVRHKHLLPEPLTLWWRYAEPHLFVDQMWRTQGSSAVDDIWHSKPGRNRERRCYVRGRLCLSAEPIVWADQAAYDAFDPRG